MVKLLLSQHLCFLEMDRIANGLSCYAGAPKLFAIFTLLKEQGSYSLLPHQKREATDASTAIY